VVGAGIAGLRCAELLATSGLEVLVLEKKKAIGGTFGENMEAFPEYHYASLDIPIPSVPVKQVTIVCDEGKEKRNLQMEFQSPVFRLVKRGNSSDSIDSHLYRRVKKTPARIIFGAKFESARMNQPEVIEVRTSEGESFQSKVLISADGVFSTVRKFLGIANLQRTEGVGYIAKVKGAKVKRSETIGVFNYQKWPGSYCYILGYSDEDFATVGMTVRPPYANASLEHYFQVLVEYLPEILGNASIIESTRGFVTLGTRDRPLSVNLEKSRADNVLFIGEAGGFQDPTLAFGLAPALISAELAANVVVKAISSNNLTLLDEYAVRARRDLVRYESRRVSFRYILETLNERELASFLGYIAMRPDKVERVMRTGEYVKNFLPMVVFSASRNPSMLTFPFRYARISHSLRNRRTANS